MAASRAIQRGRVRSRVSGNTRKRPDKAGRAADPIPPGVDGGRRMASSDSLTMQTRMESVVFLALLARRSPRGVA